MTILSRLFGISSRRENLTTAFARERLAGTMPGETGARTASRFGLMI